MKIRNHTVTPAGRSCHSSSSYHLRPSSMILAISAVILARGVYSPVRSWGFCCCFRFEGGVGVIMRILSMSSSSNSKSESSSPLRREHDGHQRAERRKKRTILRGCRETTMLFDDDFEGRMKLEGTMTRCYLHCCCWLWLCLVTLEVLRQTWSLVLLDCPT